MMKSRQPAFHHSRQISRQLLPPTSKPTFEEDPEIKQKPKQVEPSNDDIQILKDIIISKEMEICSLKKQIHALRKVDGKPRKKSPPKTIYVTGPTPQPILFRNDRQFRIFTIGDWNHGTALEKSPQYHLDTKYSARH